MSFAFFDLDDTLVDTRTALHAWALEFVAEYEIGDGDEQAAAEVGTHRVRRIFELAAGKLGVELGPDGWMVGDMLDKDVEGGIAAGLRTIWLPHDVARTAGDPEPEFAAASIGEAIAIIERSAE